MKKQFASVALWLLVLGHAACLPAPVTDLLGGTGDSRQKASDTIRTGIQTAEMIEAEPYGFRVTWIAWDSHFRGTDLRIGDRIVGVNAFRYEREQRKQVAHLAVGGWAESQYWERQSARDGQRVTLTVWRRGELLQIQGKLRADYFYYTNDGKPALGPGGPPSRFATGGFSGSWSSWYEAQVKKAVHVLDGGWRRSSFNNRVELKAHQAEKPRVDYLVKSYPGPLAQAVNRDWHRIHDVLLGPERTITDNDLEHRTLGEARARDIAELGHAAQRRFLARYGSELIEPFPAIDPIEGDLDAVRGKVVVLPELGPRDWISEAGHGYLVAGDPRRGYYFIDSRQDAMLRILEAKYRYEQLVTPDIKDTYAIVARIRGEPSLRVVNGRASTGLSADVLGTMVGGRVFIDATTVTDGRSPFAGEETLADLGDLTLPEAATPQQVMELAIKAVKVGNQAVWAELLAPWEVSVYGKHAYYNPHYWEQVPTSTWVHGRRQILGDVYDVRVVDTGIVHQLLRGDEFDGAPVIEQVDVEVEHIGRFEEGYRPFVNLNVTRVWKLQRVNGGPWRIATRKAI